MLIAIEQGYATAQWIVAEGASHDLDASRIAVAGESVGGDMTAAVFEHALGSVNIGVAMFSDRPANGR